MLSACGLICTECDMFNLPTNKAIQDKLLPWYRSQGWLKESEGFEVVLEKGMYCKGCNVDKKVFWSDGCKVAACCKDTKKLDNCTRCSEMPCQQLTDFAKQGGKYQDAYNRLASLKTTS